MRESGGDSSCTEYSRDSREVCAAHTAESKVGTALILHRKTIMPGTNEACIPGIRRTIN